MTAVTPAAAGAVSRGLGRDAFLVSVCTLFSRLTGFVRVVATAAVLGSGVLADVYQTANMIPNLLFELVAGGVLQAVLVPSFVAARRGDGDRGLGSATSATLSVVLVGLGLVTLVGMLLSPLLARLMVVAEPAASLADDKVRLMVPMVLVFVPQLVCYGVAMVTSAALNARGRYVAAALAPAVNNVVVITACVLFRAARDGAPADLDLTTVQFLLIAGGTTAGVVAFGLAPAAALRWSGVHFWPRWNRDHPAVVSLRRSFGWATLSIVGTLVPTAAALAIGNGAPGGVAVFVYAFAFYVLPHSLIAVTTATALAPRVAEAWQSGRVREVRSAIDGSMSAVLPLLGVAAAAMIALSWPVARLVGGVGQTASQGLGPIAHTLAAFGPGLLGYGVSFVMLRVLLALDDVRRASTLTVLGGVVGVIVMSVLASVFAPADRAVALALGYGAAQSVVGALLSVRVRRLTGAMTVSRVAGLTVETALAAAFALVTMWSATLAFGSSRAASLLALVVGGVTGAAVFILVMVLLRGRALTDRLPLLRPGMRRR